MNKVEKTPASYSGFQVHRSIASVNIPPPHHVHMYTHSHRVSVGGWVAWKPTHARTHAPYDPSDRKTETGEFLGFA